MPSGGRCRECIYCNSERLLLNLKKSILLEYSVFTLLADAKEFQLVMMDRIQCQLFRLLIEVTIELGYFQIHNFAAGFTDEMVVWLCIGFKAVKCAAEMNFFHHSLFDEQGKISIDGSETEIRKFFFQVLVEPVRSRVGIGCAQDVQEPGALFALSQCFLFFFHHQKFLIIIIPIIIVLFSAFVKADFATATIGLQNTQKKRGAGTGDKR